MLAFNLSPINEAKTELARPDMTKEVGEEALCHVKLLKITCHKQEDWTGTDQIYIKINDDVITNTFRIRTNEIVELRKLGAFLFSSSATLKVFEYDWDSDDLLVQEALSCNLSGLHKSDKDLTKDGAEYTIEYMVY